MFFRKLIPHKYRFWKYVRILLQHVQKFQFHTKKHRLIEINERQVSVRPAKPVQTVVVRHQVELLVDGVTRVVRESWWLHLTQQ